MLVSDIMNRNVVTISPDESVSLASRLLSRHNIGSLPVCSEDGKLRGVVTDRDIVLRCVATGSNPDEVPVREIMTRSVLTVAPGDDVSRVADLMSSAQIRRLPVVQGGHLTGIVALGDLAWRPNCDMEAARALSEISMNIKRR